MLVDAPPGFCFEVVIDFESYPEWVSDLERIRVLRRNEDERGHLIEFTVAAMGRNTTYILQYSYESDPPKVIWKLREGDLVRRLDGEYKLAPAPGEAGKTLLTYSLTVDLAVSVPGFVKRRAEARILQTALDGFRRRVEDLWRETEHERSSQAC